MARVKMAGVKIRKSQTSSSSTRSPSPPSATSPPKNSGNKSSSNTSFKSLSDHYNEAEIESSNQEINQNLVSTVHNTVEPAHATKSLNQNIATSQFFIGTIPININTIPVDSETILENVIPLQCSQPVPKSTPQEVTVTPQPITKIAAVTKTGSTSKAKKSKSKSFDSSKIRRSNRIASGAGVKPVIDTTVYSVFDSDDTISDSPKTLSGPQIKTYSRKTSFSKAKPKPSSKSESSGEEDVPLQESTPLVHKGCSTEFKNFSKNKTVLPGRGTSSSALKKIHRPS
ncbi:hypothetical protein QL285_033382 [Trifolium repens]|nr:hypothetical protein QL285_033382 [Trifolium repens]